MLILISYFFEIEKYFNFFTLFIQCKKLKYFERSFNIVLFIFISFLKKISFYISF